MTVLELKIALDTDRIAEMRETLRQINGGPGISTSMQIAATAEGLVMVREFLETIAEQANEVQS